MKLVTEYLAEAAKFERMAEDAISDDARVAFKNQAEAYRKLAIKRAQESGLPLGDSLREEQRGKG
jgi:hypothetical protein